MLYHHNSVTFILNILENAFDHDTGYVVGKSHRTKQAVIMIKEQEYLRDFFLRHVVLLFVVVCHDINSYNLYTCNHCLQIYIKVLF